jgi:hypothetical protein
MSSPDSKFSVVCCIPVALGLSPGQMTLDTISDLGLQQQVKHFDGGT